jgi:monoterpene epsilon-lactone hydrolase
MSICQIKHSAYAAIASLALLAQVVAGTLSDDGSGATDSTRAASAASSSLDANASVHLPAMVVPFSQFASPEAKTAFLQSHRYLNKYASVQASVITKQRQVFADDYQPALRRVNSLYTVETLPNPMGGVYTDLITPRNGVDVRNRNRVLINLHGGGFLMGARIMGALESIPVASLGKIKVVAVDYREGPEYKFPAASEDVIIVYKELLKRYKARNIGIYGCSAGGVLTTEAVAWIEKEKLPLPGAIGVLCASAAGWSGGDSGALAMPLIGIPTPPDSTAPPHPEVSNTPYFSEADFNDPLVMPIRSDAVLSKFPPTLIVTSTRDIALSSAVYTHSRLVTLGVEAELHVWEGLRHGFFTADPDLPETKEVWQVIVNFFDKHLGV